MSQKYNKSSGFGLIEVLLVIAIVLVAGFIGWRLYEASQAPKSPAASTQGAKPKPPKEVVSYTLPVGWRDANCEPLVVAIIPEGADTPNCKESLWLPMTVDTRQMTPRYESCAMIEEGEKAPATPEVEEITCKIVTVDGQNAFRAVTRKTDKDGSLLSTDITYIFNLANQQNLTVNYTDEKNTKESGLTKEFDTFVKSFVFYK